MRHVDPSANPRPNPTWRLETAPVPNGQTYVKEDSDLQFILRFTGDPEGDLPITWITLRAELGFGYLGFYLGFVPGLSFRQLEALVDAFSCACRGRDPAGYPAVAVVDLVDAEDGGGAVALANNPAADTVLFAANHRGEARELRYELSRLSLDQLERAFSLALALAAQHAQAT